MALGMMGFFVIHPEAPATAGSTATSRSCSTSGTSSPAPRRPIRWSCSTSTSSPSTPGSCRGPRRWWRRPGSAMRIRFGNLGDGSATRSTSTDCNFRSRPPTAGRSRAARGGPRRRSSCPSGAPATSSCVADEPGDWAMHCHKSHHTMNPMGHDVPNLIGVDRKGSTSKIRKHLPGLHADGGEGHGRHARHGAPRRTRCR